MIPQATSQMNTVADLLKLIIPGGLVLWGMYLTTKLLLEREADRYRHDVQSRYQDAVIPIRLQAFERIVLFLERISPNNLLLRLGTAEPTARELQQRLLQEIRDEYNHNLSQQVYMTPATWEQVQAAMTAVVTVINQAGGAVPPDAPAIDLAKQIFERVIRDDQPPTATALRAAKAEIQTLFL
jgi:hypothetical protein